MIHYVCVATESKLYFPYLKKLIPDLVVLGMGMKWTDYSLKYYLLIKYLKTLNNYDIVCFLDAFDVLPTKNIVKLEGQFINFSKKHPYVKIIVGRGIITNPIQKIGNDIIFCNSKLNSGTYIGYAKDILYVLSTIIKKPNICDDQVEMIKYSEQNPNDIYIDNNNDFFCVVSTPLQQVTLNGNNKCSFIHANGNGCLEDFLEEHHNIRCSLDVRNQNYIIHIQSILSKIKIYLNQFCSNKLSELNHLIQPSKRQIYSNRSLRIISLKIQAYINQITKIQI
jgi:hypothetical protein